MEIATFLFAGGRPEAMEICHVGHASHEQSLPVLSSLFGKFEVQNAQASKAEDKDRLLSVVEASFGSFTDFNRTVRAALLDALETPNTSRVCKPAQLQFLPILPPTFDKVNETGLQPPDIK